ncbi:hypothetical protein ACO0LL_27360 [Undibacterium sp. TC4M20W]|uniref:hypothetical protein n=1 Tax=Undibacterium sp. TC4M20W TaxID=3413052 RepID=UPI003BF0C7DC
MSDDNNTGDNTGHNKSNDKDIYKIPAAARPKMRLFAAVAAGVIYGLLLRVGFEHKSLHAWLQIVSTAFLILAPFSVGAIAVVLAAGKSHIHVGMQVMVSFMSMMAFLLAMFVFLLEGMVCLVLVFPVFVVAAMIGGLIAGAIHNRFRASKTSLYSFALLPLLLGPVEASLPPVQSEQLVSSVIQIQASPEEVFDQLASVQNIQPDELGFSFVHLIGLPKPIAADFTGAGVGAVRTSRWEKDVRFEEIITTWQRPSTMHYRFHILPGGIPKRALDRHVEMGGEYFDVIDGGYDLKAKDGGTELRLSTRFINKSQLKTYGDLWGKMVLNDFHQSILGLMKNRAEQSHHQQQLQQQQAKTAD